MGPNNKYVGWKHYDSVIREFDPDEGGWKFVCDWSDNV